MMTMLYLAFLGCQLKAVPMYVCDVTYVYIPGYRNLGAPPKKNQEYSGRVCVSWSVYQGCLCIKKMYKMFLEAGGGFGNIPYYISV
jgi:hypothetical protein